LFEIAEDRERQGKEACMLKTYTARYTIIPTGYMGQLVEWPEVLTEGDTWEDYRELLQDVLQEMIAAYRQQQKELPQSGALIEQIPVEI
jgi:predicted RNase H-like HicB family nuclease